MNHTFAPTMPTAMATSVTAHHGPTARWSPAITRDWSASATAMPSVTIAPQMPGKIPGTRAKGVGHVLTCSADSADGAHLRQNRAAGCGGPASGAAGVWERGPRAGGADPSMRAVTTHSPGLMLRTRAVSEIGPLPGM